MLFRFERRAGGGRHPPVMREIGTLHPPGAGGRRGVEQLGDRKGEIETVVRPFALSVVVITEDGTRHPLKHEHRGVWTAVLDYERVPDYRIEVRYSGEPVPGDDPYRFMPVLGEYDLHLLHQGQHQQLDEVLGAHVKTYPSVMGDVTGTAFTVWAPNARGVQVVGDFNHWDGTSTPMRSLGASGVWELFVPNIGVGTDRKSTRLNSSHIPLSRMPSSA